MRVSCRSCGRVGYVDPGRWAGRPGSVWCFHCARPVTHVDVSAWGEWLGRQVDRKRALQTSGQLRTRKQSTQQSDREIDADGLAGKLAACLLLCPGFLQEWQQTVESGGNNRGRDLLAAWTAGKLAVEVKYTPYRSENNGYLLVRPPSGCGYQMYADFVEDCLYVLIQPDGPFHCLSGWVDRTQFLARMTPNPVGWLPGQTECWGVHWKRLEPPDRFPEPGVVNFAVLPGEPGVGTCQPSDFWYGYSAVDGCMVVNWQDSRNKPGRSPRQLYMLRGQDDAEVRVPFNDWSPPMYRDATDYLASCGGTEQTSLYGELVSLQARIEGNVDGQSQSSRDLRS